MSEKFPFNTLSLHGCSYTADQLQDCFLGKGTERWCFRDPQKPQCVIKISLRKRCKQTRRDISYFSFLENHNVPFTHIPLYYGSLKGEGYIGISQQLITNYDGSKPMVFTDYMKRHLSLAKKLLQEFYLYLYKYNILPCDLTGDNMVIVETAPNIFRFMLIDGLGCTDLIPVAQYIPFLGRRKIKRKFRRMFDFPWFEHFFANSTEKEAFMNSPHTQGR